MTEWGQRKLEHSILIYTLVMAVTTYLIRAIPIVFVKKEMTNRFVKSFLYYVPYVCLAAMTFPAVLSSGSSTLSASLGFFTALVFAYLGKSMTTVALLSCASVFLSERILELLDFI